MATRTRSKKEKFVACSIKELPKEQQEAAYHEAITENPANRTAYEMMPQVLGSLGPAFEEALKSVDDIMDPQAFVVLSSKYWGSTGADLTVSFLDSPNVATREKILAYANKWGEFCNVKFRWSQSGGRVRIDRSRDGYWSYLGKDIDRIAAGQPTMNLEGFTERTPDSEYMRVVCHEFGHTLGAPHEHMLPEIISLLDEAKTISYFQRYQGWNAATTRAQVLTPISRASVLGSPGADVMSIMCYQLPGSITKNGKPIPGGSTFTSIDKDWANRLYPKTAVPPPDVGKKKVILEIVGEVKEVKVLSVE